MEKGFRPVWRRALGLCGEGRFARAHVDQCHAKENSLQRWHYFILVEMH